MIRRKLLNGQYWPHCEVLQNREVTPQTPLIMASDIFTVYDSYFTSLRRRRNGGEVDFLHLTKQVLELMPNR